MLFLPELIPRSVQQLAPEVDEEVLLIQQEALLKLEVRLALRFSCHLARVRALERHPVCHRRLIPSATTCETLHRLVLHIPLNP